MPSSQMLLVGLSISRSVAAVPVGCQGGAWIGTPTGQLPGLLDPFLLVSLHHTYLLCSFSLCIWIILSPETEKCLCLVPKA